MKFPISSSLFEATDGILIACFTLVSLFAVLHLHRLFTVHRTGFGPGGWFKTIRLMYYSNKPDIAHTILAVALCIRFALLWHVRHTHDHQLPEDFLVRDAAVYYFLSNSLLVISAICWCRNVSPITIKNWIWLLGILAVSSCSIWLAS
jgi:hypothetical protein